MIRIIYRCLSEKKLVEKKWNNHLALFHLKDFAGAKAVYLNGKPLKWYNILKNGDIIEVIGRPAVFSSALAGTIGSAILMGTVAATSTTAVVVGTIAILGVTAALSFGLSMLTTAFMKKGGSSNTTTSKEYSSSTQPELKGAQNDISDGIVPVLFGKTQQTPSYGQLPYRLVQDGSSTNKYRQYFISNYNNVEYSEFKLGETNIHDYSIDYLKLEQASGSSAFIGFENCKAISIDEELSYNSEETVKTKATYGTEPTPSATVIIGNDVATQATILYQLKVTNITVANLSAKSFIFRVNGLMTVQTGSGLAVLPYAASTTANVDLSTAVQSGDDCILTGTVNIPIERTNLLYKITYFEVEAASLTRNSVAEIDNFSDVIIQTITLSLAGNQPISPVTFTIDESANYYAGALAEVINTSPENTVEVDVIISFPQGLYKMDSNTGERIARSTQYEVTYKTEGGSWQPISSANALYIRDLDGNKQPLSSSTTTVSDAKITVYSPQDLNLADQLFFRPIGFEVPKGKYTVRVRCADFTKKTNYDIGVPTCSEIQFRVDADIINADILPRVNQIALEATAYKGLSGTLKRFNYVGEAIIPIWNGENWNDTAKSTNPAAVIRYLLTDENANPRPLNVDLIDNDSLVHYYEWCEQTGYKASGVIAESIKTLDVIDSILKNSQAAMIPLYNGKHTFVIDGDEKTPKGLFNQHNSWDFNWTPNVGRLTEAIRVSYVDNSDYTEKDLTVYWYDGEVHEEIKPGTTDDDYFLIKKEVKYVNDRASVLQSAKYELEVIQTKRDNFEFKCNLEALNMTLLDRIYITNSANMQNEQTGLIKSVITNGGNITGFELYAPVEIPENAQIIIRSLDYDNEQPLVNIFDVINSGMSEFVYITPVTYNAQIRGAGEITGIQDKWYYDGDLFAIGTGTIYDCVVTDIIYGEDCTATVKARNYYESSI